MDFPPHLVCHVHLLSSNQCRFLSLSRDGHRQENIIDIYDLPASILNAGSFKRKASHDLTLMLNVVVGSLGFFEPRFLKSANTPSQSPKRSSPKSPSRMGFNLGSFSLGKRSRSKSDAARAIAEDDIFAVDVQHTASSKASGITVDAAFAGSSMNSTSTKATSVNAYESYRNQYLRRKPSPALQMDKELPKLVKDESDTMLEYRLNVARANSQNQAGESHLDQRGRSPPAPIDVSILYRQTSVASSHVTDLTRTSTATSRASDNVRRRRSGSVPAALERRPRGPRLCPNSPGPNSGRNTPVNLPIQQQQTESLDHQPTSHRATSLPPAQSLESPVKAASPPPPVPPSQQSPPKALRNSVVERARAFEATAPLRIPSSKSLSSTTINELASATPTKIRQQTDRDNVTTHADQTHTPSSRGKYEQHMHKSPELPPISPAAELRSCKKRPKSGSESHGEALLIDIDNIMVEVWIFLARQSGLMLMLGRQISLIERPKGYAWRCNISKERSVLRLPEGSCKELCRLP